MPRIFPNWLQRVQAGLQPGWLSAVVVAASATLAMGQPAPLLDPFLEHDHLPADVQWVVQVRDPAGLIASEQAAIFRETAVSTEQFAMTMQAWDRLALRLAASREEARKLLGRRVQLLVRTSGEVASWALVLEVSQRQRTKLLARLDAAPRSRRAEQWIYQLEDGRSLLAEFSREDTTLLLLAPRSDRTLNPTKDPAAALFFEMFDRLGTGQDAAVRQANSPRQDLGPSPNKPRAPLATVLQALGPGELVVAWAGEAEPDFAASFGGLRADRVAGGWDAFFAGSSEPSGNTQPAPFPQDSVLAALPSERVLGWTTQPLDYTKALALVFPLGALQTGAPGQLAFTAVLASESSEAAATILRLYRLDGPNSPATFDAHMATLLADRTHADSATSQPQPTDHAGRFPGAIREQPTGDGAFLTRWGYTSQRDGTRLAAALLSPQRDPNAFGLLQAVLQAADAPSPHQEPNRSEARAFGGMLKPAALRAALEPTPTLDVPAQAPLGSLLPRIEQLHWSWRTDTLDRHPVTLGPIQLRLVPARSAELGTGKPE